MAALLAIALAVAAAFAIPPSTAPPPAAAHLARAESRSISPAPMVSIVWGGDVHIGRGVAEGMARPGHEDPLLRLRPHLAAADLRVANLEGPLTTAPRATWGYYLTGDPSSVRVLAAAGFDILGVANNHATDNGPEGLLETIAVLRDAGILAMGGGPREQAYAPVIRVTRGLRIAFLAYNHIPGATSATHSSAGVAGPGRDAIEKAVRSARSRADVVIVSPHWGVEYSPVANRYQRAAARALVDAGADAVIAHHPHVVQDVEWLERPGRRPALVAYSLGNLVFDSLAPDARRGALLWTHADHLGVKRFRAMPVRTDWLGASPLGTPADREALYRRLVPSPDVASRVDTGHGETFFFPPAREEPVATTMRDAHLVRACDSCSPAVTRTVAAER